MLWNLSLVQKNLAQICVSGIQSDSIFPWFRRITTTRTPRTARSCWVQQNPIGMCFFQLSAASLQEKWWFLLHVSAIQRHGETYVKLKNIPKDIESTKMFNFLKWFESNRVLLGTALFGLTQLVSKGWGTISWKPSIAFSTDCLEGLRRAGSIVMFGKACFTAQDPESWGWGPSSMAIKSLDGSEILKKTTWDV